MSIILAFIGLQIMILTFIVIRIGKVLQWIAENMGEKEDE